MKIKTKLINPTIPISKESIGIHGISDEDVASEPKFPEIAPNLFIFLNDCDLAGFNSNKFDVPLLIEEFTRADVFFDLTEGKKIP